jgi:TetR/AcrR family transcriptional regulator, mexJK operon transcriptional repressor
MQSRKSGTIIATARELFLARGYDSTSLDDVAAESGVSKTTVYNNFADKEALFAAVVTEVIDRAAEIVSATREGLNSDLPAEDRLRETGRALALGVMNPVVVQLRRLAITEALRFPDLVASYWDNAPGRMLDLLADAFEGMDEKGELRCPDPSAAASHFAYAILGPLQDRALLRPASPLTETELAIHADSTVSAFLRAYSP